MSDKAAYAMSQKQSRDHTCHWPGCGKQVPPAMWGCRAHWFKLPKHLRDRIWADYKPGQEIGLVDVSNAYLVTAQEVQKWIAEQDSKSKQEKQG